MGAGTWNTRQIDQITYILGRSATLCRDEYVLDEANFSSFDTSVCYIIRSYIDFDRVTPKILHSCAIGQVSSSSNVIKKFVGLPIHLQVLKAHRSGFFL